MLLYDPKDVQLIVGVFGHEITGFSPSSMVTISYNEELMSAHQGAQGEVGFGVNPSTMGTLEFSLLQVHPDNAVMSNIALLRRPFPWICRDSGGQSHGESLISVVTKMPPLKFSKNPEEEYTWTIIAPDLTKFIGGNEREG